MTPGHLEETHNALMEYVLGDFLQERKYREVYCTLVYLYIKQFVLPSRMLEGWQVLLISQPTRLQVNKDVLSLRF